MMSLVDLIEKLLAQNLSLSYLPFRKLRSVSSKNGNISLSNSLLGTLEEKEIIAYEMGHLRRGLFYHLGAGKISHARCEYRADIEAIDMLMPKRQLFRAIKKVLLKCGVWLKNLVLAKVSCAKLLTITPYLKFKE